MKKILNKLGKIAVGFLTISLGILMGVLLCGALFSGFFNEGDIVIVIIGLIVSFYLSMLIHEAGHLVFGLISGYSFCSFRIGSMMLVKQEGKINLRKMSIAGTGGQCLMTPPAPINGKIPVVMYNLGGVIANIILCILFATGYILCFHTNIVFSLLFLISLIFSFIVAITNGIPLNVGGIANDGMNALHLSKDNMAAMAFRNQLLMNAAQTSGMRISEMPDVWFEIPDGADVKNVHIASIAVFKVSRSFDRGDTESAEQEISALLHSEYNIIGLHRSLLINDLIYCKLVNGSGSVSSLITPAQKKFMSAMKNYPSIIRTQYAVALLVDNNTQNAEKIKTDFENKAKKFPYPQEICAERELMSKAFEIFKSEI